MSLECMMDIVFIVFGSFIVHDVGKFFKSVIKSSTFINIGDSNLTQIRLRYRPVNST